MPDLVEPPQLELLEPPLLELLGPPQPELPEPPQPELEPAELVFLPQPESALPPRPELLELHPEPEFASRRPESLDDGPQLELVLVDPVQPLCPLVVVGAPLLALALAAWPQPELVDDVTPCCVPLT